MVAGCAFCGAPSSPLADLYWLIRLPTCLDCRIGLSLAQPAPGGLPRPAAGGFGGPRWREQVKHGGVDERQAPGSRHRAAAAGLW